MWSYKKVVMPEPAEPDVEEKPHRKKPLDDVTLPPYTGKYPKCVKCGHGGASTKYMTATSACYHSPPLDECDTPYTYGRERMHRECTTCGYAWDEMCYEPEATVDGNK